MALLWFGNPVNRLVATAIERAGSRLTGTAVHVESVDLDLGEARGTVSGLRIRNPSGFPGGDAVILETASLTLAPQSLTPQAMRDGEPIIIESVAFTGAEVLFQVDRSGKSNLDALRRHAQEAAPARPRGEEPLLLIRKISVRDGRLTVDAEALGGPRTERDLPTLQLEDLGAPDGATPSELGEAFLVALLEKAAGAAARDEIRTRIRDGVKGVLGGR